MLASFSEIASRKTKKRGEGRRGEGEERGEAARGEVSLVLVAAGEVGVFCWRREGEMERFHGFAVSWPFRPFPLLGQGLGRGILHFLKS